MWMIYLGEVNYMRKRIIAAVVLGMGLSLVLINYFAKHPLIGLAGYILQGIGSLMLIKSALLKLKLRKQGKSNTVDNSSP